MEKVFEELLKDEISTDSLLKMFNKVSYKEMIDKGAIKSIIKNLLLHLGVLTITTQDHFFFLKFKFFIIFFFLQHKRSEQ